MNSKISVCLIVKNEEKNIERCLESIIDLSEEIIVVDTGSTDNTIPLAKSYGAKVIEYTWNNDFSDARNKSLEYATKDWILFLDADECLSPDSINLMDNILSNHLNDKFKGYYVRLVNVVSNQEIGDSVVFRLFKNDPEHRFKGKMHEQIINSVQNKWGDTSIGSTDIKILHYGYDPELADLDQKSARNIALLESYSEEEKDGYYHYSIANEFLRIQQFDKSLVHYKLAIDKAFASGRRMNLYYPYLMTSMFKLFHPTQRYEEELMYIETFKKDCKDFKDIYFQEALVYAERACFSKALKALKKYQEVSKIKSNYVYPSTNIEQLYNVPDLLKQIEEYSIPHDENLISSIIILKNDNLNIINTIKSINEISKEVIVVKENKDSMLDDAMINFGAKIVYSNSTDECEMFFDGLFKCKGDYVLKMKDEEVLSSISQSLIIDSLKNKNKFLFNLPIFDSQNNELYRDIRIIKNNRRFKKYDDFKRHIDLKSKHKQILNVPIHKIYS